MEFSFVTSPNFDFVSCFGKHINVPVHDNVLTIPPSLGTGYVKRVDLAPDFKLIIHNYTLREDFVLSRLPANEPYDLISIIFHSNEEPVSMATTDERVQLARHARFAVQISSSYLNSVVCFPASKAINYTVVGITTQRLKSLLTIEKPNRVLEAILSQSEGFLFYEAMDIDEQKILKQLTEHRAESELSSFYYRLKVQELVYLSIEKLLRRTHRQHTPINRDDSDKLFLVRTRILKDLSQRPHLQQLAKTVGMSETKMKDLFRQVFGNSIYAYFQKARMEEAAFLLKHGGYSVSDVGSRLGFQNLSHFSRLFQKHVGITPKRYSSGG